MFPGDNSDDDHSVSSLNSDAAAGSSKRRRQLPTPPSEPATTSQPATGASANESELRRYFSMERKDIEDAFKLEIVQLEDTHMREKNDMLKAFKKEKVAVCYDVCGVGAPRGGEGLELEWEFTK